MPKANPDINAQINDTIARIEGEEAVKARGRSRYLRKAATKIMNKKSVADYEPENGWEEAMKNVRSLATKPNGTAVTAVKCLAEIMGEKFDPKEKAEEDKAAAAQAAQGPVGIRLAN